MHTVPTVVEREIAQESASYLVELIGFSAIERTVFVSTFALSQRRRLRYTQHLSGALGCDLLLVDSDDPCSIATLNSHPQCELVPTVLVGEGGTDSMGWRLPRPVKWMALFEILDEALGRPIDDAAAARTLHEHSPSALVVTGSSEIARTVDAHLINAGCKVLQVADGEEAIERLAIEPYACIVVDVALSGIGGLEIARIAKGRSGQRVIVLGSSGTPLERMRASMAGCDAYLPPPLNGQALVAAIDRCMR